MKTGLKHFFILILFVPQMLAKGQSIGSLNLNYMYNPLHEIDFELKPVIRTDSVRVFFALQSKLADSKIEDYVIGWEKRESFNQREGTMLTPPETGIQTQSNKKSGWLSFPIPSKPWLLVAKVKNIKTNANWAYVKTIESKYPVNGYLLGADGMVDKPYFVNGVEYKVTGTSNGKKVYVSYYKESFLPASPPFVESESRVDRFLFQDSTFQVIAGGKVLTKSEGLYLFQEDTAADRGFAARAVRAAYPKYARVEDLITPMIYVCTQEENALLKAAKGDKAKFDKVVLDITGDKDRAKNFIRNYFRKVELANFYFSSYKEGWKTDRGMIYLIFGLPTEITYNGESEVWRYKSLGETFTFVKTGSVYGPEYFVLVRDKRFTETWYNTIDLWRKSRF